MPKINGFIQLTLDGLPVLVNIEAIQIIFSGRYVCIGGKNYRCDQSKEEISSLIAEAQNEK